MNKNIKIVILILAIIVAGSSIFFANRSTVPSFSEDFLRCNPSESKMPFQDSNVYVVTVLGAESGICHYTAKVVDQDGVAPLDGPGGIQCSVPQSFISADTLNHLLGQDKTPEILTEQTKLQTDYCIKSAQ
ncbi:MAG: hypothetical protein WC887_02750 [Candidatus Paceibacterota bacterium]|jgi:hypothetical protein